MNLDEMISELPQDTLKTLREVYSVRIGNNELSGRLEVPLVS